METMKCIEGKILTEDGFKKGYILTKNQESATIQFGEPRMKSRKKGLIIPTFINAHTHIGDVFIREKQTDLPHDIEQLVAPPNGIKHRLLTQTNTEEIQTGMIHGLQELKKHGISTFVDFRENGYAGIKLLQNALQQIPLDSIILGRPESLTAYKTEIDQLLQHADGIGLSSIIDWNFDDASLVAERTKKENKIFAVHVSERIREPISSVLSLKPTFIVHMTQATIKDLKQVKAEQIPIVICPRSNHFFKSKPNILQMKKAGNIILLGTDNFMLHQPSILEEIRFIQTHFPNLFSLEELLSMNTYHARRIFNRDNSKSEGIVPQSWMMLDPITLQIDTIFESVNVA